MKTYVSDQHAKDNIKSFATHFKLDRTYFKVDKDAEENIIVIANCINFECYISQEAINYGFQVINPCNVEKAVLTTVSNNNELNANPVGDKPMDTPNAIDTALALVESTKLVVAQAQDAVKKAAEYTKQVKTNLKAVDAEDAEGKEVAANAVTEATTYEANVREDLATAKTASKDAKAAVKDARAQVRAEKVAEKAAAKAAKEAAKASRERQNDVLHPLEGSACGKAWAIFDALSKETGEPAKLAAAVERGSEAGLNVGNIKAEYGQWRKFHGVPAQGRVKKEKPTKEETPQTSAEADAEAMAADTTQG